MRRIRILPQAEDDLLDGFRFYEAQLTGLGDDFLDSLFSDIDALMIHAGVHPVLFGKYHRMLASHFPFAVYYTLEEKDVMEHAVLDCQRGPARERSRLCR